MVKLSGETWGHGAEQVLKGTSTPEVYAEKGVGNSTSESGPRDMKDPGKSCVAVSGQRAKLGP